MAQAVCLPERKVSMNVHPTAPVPHLESPPLATNKSRRFTTTHVGLFSRKTPWHWLVLRCVVVALAGSLMLCPSDSQADVPGGAMKLEGKQILGECAFQGGLIVHAGCQDAELLVSLSDRSNALVHGLVSDRERLEDMRGVIRKAGRYGRASAMLWDGRSLPYADGIVNLLLVTDNGTIAQKEIERVLAPLGVASIIRDGVRTSYRKAWPDDVDQWTHARYDATGNAVSNDQRVGPPQFLQWEASPRWNRGVKTSGLVTTNGRIFYVLDDSHFAARNPTWSLIARDAFNGIQLWRRELPSWRGARGGKKVGPAQVNRRLVADGDRVYVTLGEFAPVSVLDAASGNVIRTLEASGPAEEFILSQGILLVLVNPNTAAGLRRGVGRPLQIVAFDASSGKRLWMHSDSQVLPLTLAADAGQAVYHNGQIIKSLDLKTGSIRWTSLPTGQQVVTRDQANPDSPGAEKSTIVLAPQFAPTLIIYHDVVAFAGGRQLNVVSATDGSELWRADYAPSNYSVPVDLFGFQGCLWGPDTQMNLWRPLDDNLDVNAYDPLTGAVRKSVKGNYGFRFQHHRCHQMKVVDDKVVAGRAGIEFLDTNTGELAAHHWMRGSCYFGVLPANGRLYVPPHDCACYVRAKLAGFFSFTSDLPERTEEIPERARLLLGPAHLAHKQDPPEMQTEDWPTYRHDVSRSGRSTTTIGADLLLGWQRELDGRLTSCVIADNRLYVASADAHTLYAVNATTGAELWQKTVDGRIDSPPTVCEGLVLFGCRDGSVHALRATDGEQAWRFVACPSERLIVSHGQLESTWPVSGSVLVINDVVYFAAGRSSYLDGGIRLYGLEVDSGRKLFDTVLSTRNQDGSELLDEQSVQGYLNDVLSSNGERIFMRHQVLDLKGQAKDERIPHLHSPDGYLSSDTTNRLLWTYAPTYTSLHQGAFYDSRVSRMLFPSGRILVEDEDTIYGYGQNRYDQPLAEPGGQWALFAAKKQINVPLDLSAIEYRKVALGGEQTIDFRWWKKLPIQVRAMVRTQDMLFVAGPYGAPLASQASLEGKTKAALLALSPLDGQVLAEMTLPSAPVWDGMAAARGNLYLALADGQVLCLWPAGSGRPGTPLSPAGWRKALPPVQVTAEPGLVGRWRFDEGAGMIARDCSGQRHDAEVFARWVEGRFGVCLLAEGAARAAVIPDAPHLQFGNEDFTLASWMKIDRHDVRLLGKEDFPENWWVINILKSGQAELVLGEGRGAGRSVRAATVASLDTDAWCHLVAVVDRQAHEVRWFLNGKLDSRHAIPATMIKGVHAAGRAISIPSSHKPFSGLISDLRIYRQTVTAERIRELFEEKAQQRTSIDFRARE
jgi:outer membrane protein assembly factor BamB